MKQSAKFLGTIAGLLLLLVLLGCSGGGGSVNSDVFVFARGSDAQKLDPADIDDGESVNTVAQICEGLVRFKSGTLEIEPCLAESYTISDDGLTYRFQLRPDVRFHDGTPLNAETALFSFQRQMDPSYPGHLKEASFAYWKYLYQDIEEVSAIGEMALEFNLSKPNASLLYSLAVFPAFLLSPAALETHGSRFQRHPVGTGPFRFVDWRPNQAIFMERNDDYWGEKPTLKRIVMTVSPDNTVRLLKLKAGDIHAMDGLQPAELAALKNDPEIKVYQEAGLNVGYLVFNLERERVANRDLREAIALAIDRETLAKVALNGAGRAAHYPMPKSFLGYPNIEDKIPLNVARAKAILSTVSLGIAIPVMFLGLLFMIFMEREPSTLSFAISIAGVPLAFRQLRILWIEQNAMMHVEASRAIGGSAKHIFLFSLFPNIRPQLIELWKLVFAISILELSALTFLGLAGDPNWAELGTLLHKHQKHLLQQPLLVIWPGLTLCGILWAIRGTKSE